MWINTSEVDRLGGVRQIDAPDVSHARIDKRVANIPATRVTISHEARNALMLKALDWLLKRTLRSVWFGIFLLASIAIYIAIGSGFPSVREYFDKDELSFFNAWPLGILMVLLVATLITVTIQRIPFTPVRAGAWIIHTGIVMLILSAFWHYSQKVEGAVLIPVGQSVTHYFDRWERSLFAQTQNRYMHIPLPGLPRFHDYDQSLGNADGLRGRRVDDLNLVYRDSSGVKTLGELIGVPDLRLTVVGYWRYANIRQRLIPLVGSTNVGFQMRLPDPDTMEHTDIVLIGGLMRYARTSWGPIELEHRPVESIEQANKIIHAAHQLHQLHVIAPGMDQTFPVSVGVTRKLGDSGYSIAVEAFDPRWRTIDQQIKPMLTLMIQTPTQTFRRQVLAGVEKPTDWLLNAEGAGPLGKRQDQPLDETLKISYSVNDPFNLLPRSGDGQVTFITTPGSSTTQVLSVPLNDSVSVQQIEGSGQLILRETRSASDVMMAAASGTKPALGEMSVDLTRQEGVDVEQYVETVPVPARERNTDQAGDKQVVRVRASAGDWHHEVLVPFTAQAIVRIWSGGLLDVPGANSPVQLQLSNTIRPLPASIRLDKFEAQAYGGMEASAGALMRNFKSFITLTNPTTGDRTPGVVSLNEPVFYDNNRWIFFQSQWDPTGQRWTVLGVGNRPGVLGMAIGCGLIIFGIFYAFYIKPIIIKAKKNKALQVAGQTAHA